MTYSKNQVIAKGNKNPGFCIISFSPITVRLGIEDYFKKAIEAKS